MHAHGYSGSQPGVMRKVFAMLPGAAQYSFLDLGCGKGRPLLVATEFPFKEIVGIELSLALAQIARNNAEIMSNHYSGRRRVRIEVGDATKSPIPSGDVVLFMANPFDEAMIRKMAVRVEAALALEERRIFVVYLNPTFGGCFDAVASLRRRFTGQIPCAREELDTARLVTSWRLSGKAEGRTDTPRRTLRAAAQVGSQGPQSNRTGRCLRGVTFYRPIRLLHPTQGVIRRIGNDRPVAITVCRPLGSLAGWTRYADAARPFPSGVK